MSALGPVRAVEVAPSAPDASSEKNPAAAAAAEPTKKPADFDVNALLENMPQPRALAKGKGGGRGGGRGGAGADSVGGGGGSGGGLVVVGLAAGLNVDAWVQFEGFRGFERALKGLRGRVMQHRNAELLCEYQLGVDTTGYMTDGKRREREIARAEEANEVRDVDNLNRALKSAALHRRFSPPSKTGSICETHPCRKLLSICFFK